MAGNAANRRIRRLTTTEVDAYDLIPPDLAARVWLVAIRFIPGRYDGMTLGRFVLLEHMPPATGTNRLLAHELVHVRQWSELGFVGFLVRYLGDFIGGLRRHRNWHRAYRDIKAEEEARREADAWSERQESLPPDAS